MREMKKTLAQMKAVLDGKNYRRWALMMRPIFVFHEVLEIVQEGTSDVEENASKEKDCLALSIIQQCVNSEFLEKIGAAQNAKEAWEILNKAHGGAVLNEAHCGAGKRKRSQKSNRKMGVSARQKTETEGKTKKSTESTNKPHNQNQDPKSSKTETSETNPESRSEKRTESKSEINQEMDLEETKQIDEIRVSVKNKGAILTKKLCSGGCDNTQKVKPDLEEEKALGEDTVEKFSEGSLPAKEKPKVKAREHEHNGDGNRGESDGSHERTLFPGKGQPAPLRETVVGTEIPVVKKPKANQDLSVKIVEKALRIRAEGSKQTTEIVDLDAVTVARMETQIRVPKIEIMKKKRLCSHVFAKNEGDESSKIRVLRKRSIAEKKNQGRRGRTQGSVDVTKGKMEEVRFRSNREEKRTRENQIGSTTLVLKNLGQVDQRPISVGLAQFIESSGLSGAAVKQVDQRGVEIEKSGVAENHMTLDQSGVDQVDQAQCLQSSEWINAGLIFKQWDPGISFCCSKLK